MKGMSWKGRATGVIFSFLKSITFLKDEFQTDRVVFCFEHPHLFRRDIYPSYKHRRYTQQRTEAEKVEIDALRVQIAELRQRYLPKIGFKNVFSFNGMESDDIMAAIAFNLPEDEEAILVTADSDLHQCLRDNVTIYSPGQHKILTEAGFKKMHGIKPSKWAVVKAIAGCPSDEIEGIHGVGPATALKYLKGELKVQTKAYQSIVSEEGRAIVMRNKALVKLPYEGCPVPLLQEDEISQKAWLEVCESLGMKSIASRAPIATRKAHVQRI